jgi:hypothetical protein
MKSLLLSILLLAAAAASAQQPGKLDGKWQIHNNIMGNESSQNCAFTQKDKEFTATCDGSATLAGKFDGDKIKWQLKSEYNGSPITLDYTGHFDSEGKIVGTVTVNEFNVDGEFTATLAK